MPMTNNNPSDWQIEMEQRDDGSRDWLYRWILWLALVALVLFWCGACAVVTQAQVEASTPFRDCVNRAGGQPINVIWTGAYVESMRNPDMINRVLNLSAMAIKWNSDTGAQVPAEMQTIRNKTLALTLSDGTLVSLIINMTDNQHYVGWMTYSTYRTSASYNPSPNPHVLCGFWLIDIQDYENLRASFLESLTQDQPFQEWMR